MQFRFSDFSACEFPEEYLFWSVFISGAAFVISFLCLHLFVSDSQKKFGFFPVVFLLFKKDAFYGKGFFFRNTFLISFVLSVTLSLTIYIGLDIGVFDCGFVR